MSAREREQYEVKMGDRVQLLGIQGGYNGCREGGKRNRTQSAVRQCAVRRDELDGTWGHGEDGRVLGVGIGATAGVAPPLEGGGLTLGVCQMAQSAQLASDNSGGAQGVRDGVFSPARCCLAVARAYHLACPAAGLGLANRDPSPL